MKKNDTTNDNKLRLIHRGMKPIQLARVACLSVLLFFAGHAMAGGIKGKVTNEKKEPVPYASVSIKGSQQVVATDKDGLFDLYTDRDNVLLLVSSVGYETKEIKVSNGDGLVVVTLKARSAELPDVEMVSSGYQDIPKERATGSFVKIDNATLNQQTGTNILKRLDGVTSGLLFTVGKQNNNPQNRTNITIRGLSTINGPLDPLIVLDGFIYEGDIDNLNPNDIESVTVLKDAAAASIWGARAGNGVIVLTSKKGRFNQKMQVSVNANVLISEKPDLYYLPQMASSDYIDVESLLFKQGYFDGQINSDPYKALTPAVDIFNQRRQAFISAADSAAQIDLLRHTDGRDQYLQYFYTPAITQQYALNLRGGTEKNAYTFSAAFDKNRATDWGQSQKINLGISNSFSPVKGLQLTVRAYYTNSEGKSGRGLTYGSIKPGGRDVPYLRFADEQGNALPIATTLSNSYADTAGAGKLLDWHYYPLTDYRYQHGKTDLEELFANVGVQYAMTPWLDINLGYQYQRQQTEISQLNEVGSFTTRSIINNFTQLDPANGIIRYNVPMGGIQTKQQSDIASQTIRGQLNFHLDKGDHQVAAIAGAESRQATGSGGQYTLYGYLADPLSYRKVDFVNYYPTYVTGGYETIGGAPYNYSSTINRFVSLYGNAGYTYRQKYILSGSMRRDGSNIFGASTNDKWKPLWSAGMAWKISRESFYKAGWLPQLGLRLTYGHSGNVDLSRTAEAIGVYYSGTAVTDMPVTRIQMLNNPSLKWEESVMLNLGLDFTLRDNRLAGSLEYYHKKGSDLYGSTAFDYTAWRGNNTIVRNVAEMKGNGVDMILRSRNLTGAFSWQTDFLFSYNTSKTTKYESAASRSILSIIGTGTNISPVVGKPLYAIASYKWGGLDASGNPQGYVAGKKSIDYPAIFNEAIQTGGASNVVYAGAANPVYYGGLLNRFSWKGISLSANITYKAGYYFKGGSISYSTLVNSGNGHSDYAKRWQKPGDEVHTTVPSFQYPVDELRDGFYGASEVGVMKGGHIRLQYINLAYKLPLKSVAKSPMNAELYFNLANLGIIWRANKAGLDPDYPGTTPPSRVWTIGLRAGL